jgi:hypothetical protein
VGISFLSLSVIFISRMLKKAIIHRVVAASLAIRINQVCFIPVISKSFLKSSLDQLMVLADNPPHEEEGNWSIRESCPRIWTV